MKGESNMQMTRIDREDITTVIYSILTRKGLSVKFKVKLYTKDKNQDEQFYHQEFILQKNKISINLAPRPYLEWVLCHPNSEGAKVVIYVTEVFKQRIVRKLTKIAQAFEAYDDGEIDILTVNATGTHIRSELSGTIKVVVGVQTLLFTPIFNESDSSVKMQIVAEGSEAYISVQDFLCLYYRLRELNFTQFTMQLVNYIGTGPLGHNQIDFRRDKVNQNIDIDDTVRSPSFSKISIMGSLIDIENPTEIIKVDNKNNKPKW